MKTRPFLGFSIKTIKVSLALASTLGSISLGFASPSVLVVDSFTDGSSFTDSNTSGTASYNYLTGAADILGGRRQVRTRAAGSGFYGPSVLAVNTTADTLSSYGGDTGDRFLQYGSAIGSLTFTGAGPGSPVNLNLDLTLASSINVNVVSASSGDSMSISLLSGNSTTTSTSFNINSAGIYSVSLSAFSGLTAPEAADINGIMFSPNSGASTAAQGLVLSELSITVPEPSSCALLALALAFGLPLWHRKYRLGKH